MQEVQTFYASGKLLLFGEYLVLRGTSSLAIPLKFGQKLRVTANGGQGIQWKVKELHQDWFSASFSNDLEVKTTTDQEKANVVRHLLQLIQKENPSLVIQDFDFDFEIEFDQKFGWGTSSTLLSLISQWARVNPYTLLEQSFKGSGYDLAAATADQAFIYQIKEKVTQEIILPQEITDALLFVYLGKKQSSGQEITKFKDLEITDEKWKEMNALVSAASRCSTIEKWEDLMQESEDLLSAILNRKKVKEEHFSDYPFAIKSLGAWGGDFIMATYRDLEEAQKYFLKKGFQPVFTFNELIK